MLTCCSRVLNAHRLSSSPTHWKLTEKYSSNEISINIIKIHFFTPFHVFYLFCFFSLNAIHSFITFMISFPPLSLSVKCESIKLAFFFHFSPLKEMTWQSGTNQCKRHTLMRFVFYDSLTRLLACLLFLPHPQLNIKS